MAKDPEYVRLKLHHYQLVCQSLRDLEENDKELKDVYTMAKKKRDKRKDMVKSIYTLLRAAKVE